MESIQKSVEGYVENFKKIDYYNASWKELQDLGLPFTTWTSMGAAIVAYLVTLGVLRMYMANRKRLELTWIVPLHNFFLSALSLVMGVASIYYLYQIFSTSSDAGNDFFCDTNRRMIKSPYNFWFYVFYLSKYYELLDTVIIVLKKRPIIFLHIYHHIITMVLVFVMFDRDVAVRWLPMVANSFVHVPMYYYYAASAIGINIWWKKYITVMQIWQFVVDLVGNSTTYYYINKGITCSCTLESWIFGQSILLSFLILFLNFFRKTYAEKKSSHSNSSTNGSKGATSPQKKARKDE